jgi:glutathione-specific gamma-glutamylcyclotransferase
LSDEEDRLRALLPTNGLLQREHFTADRVRAYAEFIAKNGGPPLMSEEAREASRRAVETAVPPDSDVWVFGYGSLMWNPAIKVVESRKAVIAGFHRQFCLTLNLGRGTPENPGLMLALDRGGDCIGVAHRIAAKDVSNELTVLWYREMLSGAYLPQWVDAQIDAVGAAKALTFVINPRNPRYEPNVSDEAMAERIAKAQGLLGTNRDYLYRTVHCLDELGIKDGSMHRLEARVRVLAHEPLNTNEGENDENHIV